MEEEINQMILPPNRKILRSFLLTKCKPRPELASHYKNFDRIAEKKN